MNKRFSLSLSLIVVAALIAGMFWVFSRFATTINGQAATTQATPTGLQLRHPYDPQITQKDTELWAKLAREEPKGSFVRVKLAGLYMQRYRETGDIADAAQAEKTARYVIKMQPGEYSAYEILARALLTQHRFREALQVADIMAKANPEAHRIRTDILLDLGEREQAAKALDLVPRTKNDANRIALRARLWEAQGQPEEALRLYQEVAKLLDANYQLPADMVAAVHRKIGQTLYNLGRVDQAEKEFQIAVEVFPRDYQTMYGMARLKAGRGDWKAALEWAEKSVAIVPAPETIALLGDAHAALGDNEAAKKQYQLVEDIGALGEAQGAIYDRQRAMFYADHDRNFKKALKLARNEMKLRHDVYAYDALAWVSYKNGLLQEAQAAMQKALATGTRDALLEYHAGVIAHAAGNKTAAKTHLKNALEINPYFYPPSPQRARELLAKLEKMTAAS